MSQYVSFCELNDLQISIMKYVDTWVHERKTPIPRKKIIENMLKENVKIPTTIKSINSLIAKGYLRRSAVSSNKTMYVQLRRV